MRLIITGNDKVCRGKQDAVQAMFGCHGNFEQGSHHSQRTRLNSRKSHQDVIYMFKLLWFSQSLNYITTKMQCHQNEPICLYY